MKWSTRFSKVKHKLGDAYSTSMKWVSVADRAHALLSKGYGAVQDRLEPEVQEKAGGLRKGIPLTTQETQINWNCRLIYLFIGQAHA